MNDKGRQVITENVTAKYSEVQESQWIDDKEYLYGQGVLKSAIFDKAECLASREEWVITL